MKKEFFIVGLLLAGVMQLNAQTGLIETVNETGLGTQNGAAQSASAATGSTFVGYQAGFANTGIAPGTGAKNSFVGSQAGRSNTTGTQNTYVGFNSGYVNTTGNNNVFIGGYTGYNSTGGGNTFTGYYSGYNTSSEYNSFYGFGSGRYNTTGTQNVFIGANSGFNNVSGTGNTFSGTNTGINNTTGFENTYLGFNAGYNNKTSGMNTFVGTRTGFNTLGSGNVFLGHEAGTNETGSNKFYLAVGTNTLMYGDFATGKIAIGGATSFPTSAGSVNVSNYKLFVKGGILTEEVRIQLATGWADYVFADNYKLPSLNEVEQFIAKNGHLPNVPSAKQVKEDGIELGQMANIQQEKIEELTLYAIEQNKQIETQKSQLEQQQKEIDELKAAVKSLVGKQ
ncbi:FtsB/FtsL family cell division protein [Flavobacterium cerinum]|uniref:TMF family protein n=1 Tax=Flavobacterium cerinum TaxID=2502784 RepID=A0A444GM93_9FLAO|nr:hypothetical protein [Flavobacterium cerinum]RWW92093.1 hypothetical protein EPI11_16955 [Flavobacterium cerinum]